MILLLISFGGYFLLQTIIEDEIKEDIREKEYAVIQEIKTENNLINLYPFIETKKIKKRKIEPKAYHKIYLLDGAKDELEPFIEYSNSPKINNDYYLIRIRHSLIEKEDLILAIALPLFLLLILAFSFSFFVTKRLNKTIWKDFEQNLKVIEDFSFKNTNKLVLKNTEIEEFDKLNKAVLQMTEKLKEDYFSLKEFTENASHEIQTPISIVLLNLEELLQENLNKSAFAQVVSSINAIKRLSSLNQSLILLTKIENRQFTADSELDVNNIIEQKIKEFKVLFETKNLKVELIISGTFTLKINDKLMDILISNLLSNAVKHNLQNGNIQININKDKFTICNTGSQNSLSDKTIFKRFTKQNSASYGLGLAIVHKICDTHQLKIQYTKNELHCFMVEKRNHAQL
jgi:signal transduction histidine kinase